MLIHMTFRLKTGDRGARRTLLLLDAIFRNSLGNSFFHNRTKGLVEILAPFLLQEQYETRYLSF